jgi:hypothetical protein
MPTDIQYFVWLSIAQTVVSFAGMPFGPAKLRTTSNYITSVLLVLLWAVFVWGVAWQRIGYARWGVVALVSICIPGFLLIVRFWRSQYPIFVGAQAISLMFDFGALFFIFTADAERWLK